MSKLTISFFKINAKKEFKYADSYFNFILIVITINLLAINTDEIPKIDNSPEYSINVNPMRLVLWSDLKTIQFGLMKVPNRNETFALIADYYYLRIGEKYPTSHILDLQIALKSVRKKRFDVLLGAFSRMSYITGYPGTNDNYEVSGDIYSEEKKSIYKFGIGLNWGIRFNLNSRFYMESNLKFGGYLLGKSNQLHGMFLGGLIDQDALGFIAIDLMKFDYSFNGSLPSKRIISPINHSVGFSINPFKLLYLLFRDNDCSEFLFGFSLNYFSKRLNANIELSPSWKNDSKNFINDRDLGIEKTSITDFRVKKYLSDDKVKTYFCTAFRYCRLEGTICGEDDFPQKHSTDKFAIGGGGGFNLFIKDNWYLDFYIVAGKYLLGENYIFSDSESKEANNRSFFWEFGSFKIGYRFGL